MLSITLICERGSVETVQQMGMGHCYLLSQNKNETSITEDSNNISQSIKKDCHFHGSHTLNELRERLFVKKARSGCASDLLTWDRWARKGGTDGDTAEKTSFFKSFRGACYCKHPTILSRCVVQF